MPLKDRSATPRGQMLDGEEPGEVACCPECEVVLPSGIRFSYALGLLCSQGWHVHHRHDGRHSVEWTVAAAKRGQVGAQRELGLKYLTGSGVPQDYVRAYGWLNLAAAAGDAESRASRDALQGRMTPEQVARAQKISTEWHDRLVGSPALQGGSR